MAERNLYPELTGEFSRWRENAIKVAGVFAVAEGSATVESAHANRACGVIHWTAMNYIRMLQAGREERREKAFGRDWERMREILNACGGRIALGKLQQRHGIKRERVEELIAAYPGWITIDQTPREPGKPGRTPETVTWAAPAAKAPASMKVSID
jgi:hypothetical protein